MPKVSWRDHWKNSKVMGKRLNFESDGCSNAPDLNFRECCEKHDFDYRNYEITGITRVQADKCMRECMRKKWSLFIAPWIYWTGVRCFGWIAWNKNKKREKNNEEDI